MEKTIQSILKETNKWEGNNKKITKKAEYLAKHMASSFSTGKGGRKVFSSLSE